MNAVDVVLLGAIVVFAWTGWRQGFVHGLLSFVGFLGGGVLGALLLPRLLGAVSIGDVARALLVAFGVFLCAALGQGLLSLLGRRVRAQITWAPGRTVDNAGGAVLNVAALAVVAWIVAAAVAVLPVGGLAQQVRSSVLLGRLDATVPDVARNWFSELRDLLDTSDFPRVFAGLGFLESPAVAAPDPKLLKIPAVRASWASLVKVSGSATQCRTDVTGSGFVYARDRVMTNAHVVAGVSRPVVRIAGDRTAYAATTVYIDPQIDVAILSVPNLPATALAFAGPVQAGASAVVAGFPGGGPLTASAARIRAQLTARGEDIYGNAGVVREVYAFRGLVRPGNSGGPLLDPRGRVLGVVFAAAVSDPDTGYALTARQVAAAAAAGRRGTVSVPTGSCRTT